MTNDNDSIFEQAAAVFHALRMIESHRDVADIAGETGLDARFVLALTILLATEGVSA
jgi:DNA-binding phage protein